MWEPVLKDAEKRAAETAITTLQKMGFKKLSRFCTLIPIPILT
jgi:hypothetical protein